jgi:MinD-like ATPase involved in chromosome partitioning or flagellar assembly
MICVLVVAAGAAWEPRALAVLSRTRDAVVLKRCVDVEDLLASASTGQADVALVALDAPGLDAAAVEHLVRYRVRPVAVVAHDGAGAVDAARMRAARWGIKALLGDAELDRLGDELSALPDPSQMPTMLRSPDPTDANPPRGPSEGRIVAVWGSRGAPGVTTVAINVAAVQAARGLATVLVDANPYGGSVAQQLGLTDPVSGLLTAARLAAAGTLRDRFPTTVRSVGGSLCVVTGLPRPDRWMEVRAGVIEHLLEVAAHHGQVVVDTGFSLEHDPAAEVGARPGRNTLSLGAIGVAHEIVVVGAADPVGLARLARGLVELREVAGGTPLRVVVNRYRSTLGWSRDEITGMVEGFARVRAVHFMPEDQPSADRALVTGRTLVERGDSELGRAIEGVVDGLAPESVRSAPPSLWRRARVRRRRAGTARLP